MKKIKRLLLLCCSLFVVNFLNAQESKVLFSTFSAEDPPSVPTNFMDNISTVSVTQKKVLADNFDLEHKSKITRFNFIGQIGKTAPGDSSLITGVHVFVFGGIRPKEKENLFSAEETSLAHFYLDASNPGLLKKVQNKTIEITVDLELAGKELILEAKSNFYWVAFAPVVAAESLSEDKVWYWYEGFGPGYDTLVWNNGDTEWSNNDVGAMAFSIEGKETALSIPKLGVGTITATIYPNPSNGIFKITALKEITAVSVYSTTGQLMLQNTSEIIDLSAFPKGIYFATVTYNDGTKNSGKLIKT